MIETDINVKRCIYFKGHRDEKDSAHIAGVCTDCSTLPSLNLECATRTLLNLYNLHTVRGNIINNTLDIKSSMSGPHMYYGHLDPKKRYILEIIDNHPLFKSLNEIKNNSIQIDVPEEYILTCQDTNWIKGKHLSKEDIIKYNLVDVNHSYIDVDNKTSPDSLFTYPGILEMNEITMNIPFIQDPQNYNLSSFGVQMVKNDNGFTFNQNLIKKYIHAQHPLRVITYHYGSNYVKDYLLNNSGLFLEKHEFIQLITPSNKLCGGYVILGRYIGDDLQLIRISIPYGYSLLVDVLALHGDSGLIGDYIMCMTGHHIAMSTSDTVYLKNKLTYKNVMIDGETLDYQSHLLLTSQQMTKEQLIIEDQKLYRQMIKNVNKDNKLYMYQKMIWNPVIMTPNNKQWTKTKGYLFK